MILKNNGETITISIRNEEDDPGTGYVHLSFTEAKKLYMELLVLLQVCHERICTRLKEEIQKKEEEIERMKALL